MFSRTPFYTARGSQAARRICAVCRSERASLYSTATQTRPAVANKDEDSTPTTKPKRRRESRVPRPHPAPPNPPWPKSSERRVTVRPYMTPRALSKNAFFVGQTSGVLLQKAAHVANKAAAASITVPHVNVSLGVPRMPDLEEYYTRIGPGVVAPWQPGGVPFTSLNTDVSRSKRTGIRLRVCYAHVIHPYSVKFLFSFDDIAPTAKGGGQSPSHQPSHGNQEADSLTHSGFPHCLAEVVRRYYANKNRTDPLWWFVSLMSNDNAGGADLATVKNVLRSKMHAKVQHAFKTALARQGYSPSGWRLHETATASGTGEERVVAKHPHLYGSVRVDAVLQRVLEANYEEMVTYMTSLIPSLEAALGSKGDVIDGVVCRGREPYTTHKPYANTTHKRWPKPQRRDH